MRQVIIYPGEDGYWVAECPSLPGCISQGRTKEEAIANIGEAIRGYVKALEQDDLPVPEERFDALLAQIVVPDHKELDRGTLRAIIRQFGLRLDEFVKLL